jgi:hypothetical protein
VFYESILQHWGLWRSFLKCFLELISTFIEASKNFNFSLPVANNKTFTENALNILTLLKAAIKSVLVLKCPLNRSQSGPQLSMQKALPLP